MLNQGATIFFRLIKKCFYIDINEINVNKLMCLKVGANSIEPNNYLLALVAILVDDGKYFIYYNGELWN